MTKQIDLIQHLKRNFGFDSFKGNQEEIIRNVLHGNDTFVLMPTGGGKSLCYQLPALMMEGTAIVISPLIALMKNQVDAMRNFGEDDGVAHFLNSSLTKAAIAQVKEDVTSGRTKLLYVAPESLTKEENILFLQSVKISFYAVDEAHCISEWGHDFRPEYRRIRPIINEIGEAPIIALTATATPKVQHDIQKTLGIQEAHVFKSSFNRPNLYYEIRPKVDASKEIIKMLKENPGKSCIIYCLSRKKVEELAELLVVNGIKALAYHAGMDAATRAANQDKFLYEEVDVIVATIAFGMGIDKPDVRIVIHYDMPKSLEGYYQETGRAGRDGGEGRCIAFYSYKDIQKLEKFMQGKPVAEQEIGKQLLIETVAYAETSLCRRKLLLHYFGEQYTEDSCDSCDNCLHPKEQFEGMEAITTLIKVILETKEKFKTDHVIDVLTGKESVSVKAYGYQELEIFGVGDDQDDKYWDAVIRHALIEGLIVKEIENYGLLKISDKGREYLKKPYSILITKNHDYSDMEDESRAGGGTAAVDLELFSLLKDLRKEISRKLNLPPFVIFQDPSLEAMSTYYPVTVEELQNMPGVGVGKAKRFGDEFLKLIKRHVEENDIDRPIDMVVKSVANKSKLKISIIQSIDRKVPLNDLAEGKGIEMNELLKELESIVYSGTRVNIDYYIDQVMDEEHRDDIFSYFKEEAESDDITTALMELGEDEFTEEEVRMVRIKFISEVGN
ncbi:DNA helicase RecQ [Xiashengella succiniciproducens]|uniref:DNA helicase RecQ n=1 Tax=Xiashengella succiniciproducens TaxID=2949635 RepID=A0A9J6ZR46_9BACT|nr:DNA helicase RecQ [Alkaliflexus sp. Ai-910]URW80081.1 DNA helicase RecQ [Alkaliflexus sp. Ai-910]